MKVQLIESERGWGNKVIETLEFDEPNVAEAFCRGYNSHYNPPGETPDYYIYARLEDQNFGMLR